MKILLTGGAGYIGSYVAYLLNKLVYEVAIFDNLENGHKWALKNNKFYFGDIRNFSQILEALSDFRPDAIMHFAAYIKVEESTKNPCKYYENNVIGSLNLIKAALMSNVRYFIFSSTAAVYGIPKQVPISEDSMCNPINPYGESKLMVEKILKDIARSNFLKFGILRYFNVAGADIEAKLGQANKNPTHLITRVLRAALGKIPYIEIFGTDYPTEDGTCVRDYIHIKDLAFAHIEVLNYIKKEDKSEIFNVGYGKGYSVKEIIKVAKKITKVDFPVKIGKRRPGDPPKLIADPKKLLSLTNWEPKHNNIETIIKDAWEWECYLNKNPILLEY